MPLVTIEDLETESKDKVASYLRWAEDLGDLYEQFVEEDDEDVEMIAGWGSSRHREGKAIRGSELSGCQRRVVYALQATERRGKIPAFWKKKFRAGHMLHAMIQNDLYRMCEKTNGLMVFKPEVKVKQELHEIAARFGIKSTADGIIEFRDQPFGPVEMRVLIEIKTESPDEWTKIKEPKEHHLEQTTLYQKCLDVPIAWILYYNKGTQRMIPSRHPFVFPFNHTLWGTLEARILERYEDAKNDNLPDREEGILCEFCPFAWKCEPAYLAAKKRRKQAREARTKKVNPNRRSIRAPGV